MEKRERAAAPAAEDAGPRTCPRCGFPLAAGEPFAVGVARVLLAAAAQRQPSFLPGNCPRCLFELALPTADAPPVSRPARDATAGLADPSPSEAGATGTACPGSLRGDEPFAGSHAGEPTGVTPQAPMALEEASSAERSTVAGFAPGALLAGRYRIVSLLGAGGMGAVYRADDLRLGQAVALKFLPSRIARSAGGLQRFLREVRTARQVAHPGVCRVYDIGEVAGRHFLTMEYVDGEDLVSLLRRIGRLPAPKALEVACQLAAGLRAVHERGILHRDLKPANVMLDGRGQVRITDFGLAVAEHDAPEELSGTLAYMAPERLAGAAASVQSDLYALGLVLYEIFAGCRPFEARTPSE